MTPKSAYNWLKKHHIQTSHIGALGDLAAWDQRTYLPPKGHHHRAEQLAAMALLVHERQVKPEIGEHLSIVEGSDLISNPTLEHGVNIREWRRSYDRATKIPGRLAEELARATAEGETAWEKARNESNWSLFAPHLEKIIALTREKADALGYDEEPYDALIEDYEPGQTTASLIALFGELKAPLISLVDQIAASAIKPDIGILKRHYPVAAQKSLSKKVARQLGYDFEAGRLDESAHPFTLGITPTDVRITTRFNENSLTSALLGTIHEAGHGMYEQGLPIEHYGTPRGRFISLGIHESQSRLFENLVGRSTPFWQWAFPQTKKLFSAFKDVSLEDFILAINDVRPSLVRVESDEVTYNLHIILRFELEIALLRGEIAVGDLPHAWNEKMTKMFHLTPQNDGEGVLQDVHWSAGLIGYFPTYALGNVYAAQLFAAAKSTLPDLDDQFQKGHFKGLLTWLRRHVHELGSTYQPGELIRHATGEAPTPGHLINYLKKKFTELYGL